jgi:hypothetical protein
MKRAVFFTSLVALVLAACSDSDSGVAPSTPVASTTDVVTVGPISGFGSVVSHGIHFNTNGATILVNGDPGTLSDLRVGMIVSIKGTIDDDTGAARASEIRFAADLVGPVTSVNRENGTFVMMGRTIVVDGLTVADGDSLDALAAGHVVQVSGQYRSQDRIQATHMLRVANEYQAGMQMQVRGEIENLDVGNLRFRVGGQDCDYSGASLELGGADLQNGLFVEVTSTAPMVGGDMILDRIQAHDRDRDRDQLCDSDCDFEVEGYVTAFVSATEFEVDGQAVTTTDTTVYVNGTVDSLALDVKLAVDGTVDADGVLVAERIVFRLPSLVEIDADIEAIDTAAGSVTLMGINVQTDEMTLFRDHSIADVTDFGLDDLAVGDRAEIRACIDGDTVMATRLERDDADDGVTLMAPVESVDRPSLTLLGVVSTSDLDTVFQNAAKEVIDADTFFSTVETGGLVRNEGALSGGAILADKMFLRECGSDSCT